MPETAATKAEKGDDRYNNYYLTDMSVDGLSPKFNMYVHAYNLSVSGDTTVYIKLPNKAQVVSPMANVISKGDNSVKITVQSESGYTDYYTLNVESLVNCTLTFKVGDPSSGEEPPSSGDDNPPSGDETPPDGGETPPWRNRH